MSNSALTHVWTHSKQSSTHLLVMVALADAANNDGLCWWGKSKLSERCRLSETRLNAVIRDLERAGELQVIEGGYDKDLKRNVSNHYLIMGLAEPSAEARPIEPAKPKRRNFEPKSEGHGGNTVDPHMGVTRLTHPPQHGLPPVGNTGEGHGGNTVDPFPILEPTDNPKDNHVAPDSADDPKPPKTKTLTEHQLMSDAIVQAFGWSWDTMTPTNKTHVGKVARELRGAKATPNHVSGLYAYCDEQFDGITPAVLSKHWAAYVKDVLGGKVDAPDEPTPQVTHTREALGLPPMPDVDYVAIANMTPAQRQQQIDALLDELDRTKGLSYVSQ